MNVDTELHPPSLEQMIEQLQQRNSDLERRNKELEQRNAKLADERESWFHLASQAFSAFEAQKMYLLPAGLWVLDLSDGMLEELKARAWQADRLKGRGLGKVWRWQELGTSHQRGSKIIPYPPQPPLQLFQYFEALPKDLRQEIARLSGVGAIAKLCLVSRGYLEEFHPILTGRVEIRKWSALLSLLCRKPFFLKSPLNSLLSMDNLKAITLTASSLVFPLVPFIEGRPASLLAKISTYPLPLERLKIIMDIPPAEPGSEILKTLPFHSSVLSLFNPTQLIVEIDAKMRCPRPRWRISTSAANVIAGYTRLKDLQFRGAVLVWQQEGQDVNVDGSGGLSIVGRGGLEKLAASDLRILWNFETAFALHYDDSFGAESLFDFFIKGDRSLFDASIKSITVRLMHGRAQGIKDLLAEYDGEIPTNFKTQEGGAGSIVSAVRPDLVPSYW